MKIKTYQDSELQKVKNMILNGWPDSVKKVPTEIKQYYSIRDDLTVEDDLLFKSNRVIIPKTMRSDVMKTLHQSHQGIEKTKQIAKDVVYWPGLQKQIEEMIHSCDTCLKFQNQQQKEPMLSYPKPERPWQTIGSDLFEFDGRKYLLTVDYYSEFFEIDYLSTTTSARVIEICKKQFARYGISDTFISDNGVQYNSKEFQSFTKNYQFEHVTSSPMYPQSNGKSEKIVQIAKNLLKKAKEDKQDP